MHSRIFQLEKEKVEKDEMLEAWNIEEGDDFIGPVSDYVDDIPMESWDKEIAVFGTAMYTDKGVVFDPKEKSIVFSEEFIESYFQDKYDEFKTITKILTQEDFRNYSGNLYRAGKAIDNIFGYYFYTNGDLRSMDSFLRNISPGKKFYFGSVLDYHY